MAAAWTVALRRRAAVLVWGAAMLVAITLATRAHFVADLSAFLPSRPSPEQALLLEQLSSGTAAKLVLIGIEGGTAPARAEASTRLASALRESGAFETVLNGLNNDGQALNSTTGSLFAQRYLLSPAVNAERFSVAGLREGIADSLALLGTPAGAFIKPVLLRDPTGESLRLLEGFSSGGGGGPRSEGGVWVSRNAARAVLLTTTRANGADLDAQERAMQLVQHAFEPQAQQGLRLLLSGPGTFGVSSRATIKAEVERLAAAGTVLMALLLWCALGSLRGVALALLPVAGGVLAGIAAVSLGFGQVHGITLGFGTTLIGEAVDYAIYYLIQARPALGASVSPPAPSTTSAQPGALSDCAQRWIANNWPTVRLGLLTSLCGFAALLFSGFGGLAQLGLFSMAGLVAAALTTRFVFPHLAPEGSASLGLRQQLGHFSERAVALLSHPALKRMTLAGAGLALAALLIMPSAWHANLSSLSSISQAELQLDAALRADLGSAESTTLVVLAAQSEAQALELAEAAGERLDRLVSDGLLRGFDSPARILPSPKLQRERRDVLPDAATLRERLAQATAGGPLPAQRLQGFIDDVQAARNQPVLTRAALQGTALASAVDAMLMPATPTRPWRTLLSLRGGAQGIDAQAVRQALADVAGAQVLNVGDELGALYQRYLREAAWQAALGAVAVLALLALHLRDMRRLLRLCQPIAAACLIVVAALAGAGVALGILHLVGLLLVVAIGSNYALFFDHLREQGDTRHQADEIRRLPPPAGVKETRGGVAFPWDRDTLASLLLANLTTVLSFGLLAFSNIQALHAIGQVVAPGALLCLVLSATLIAGGPDSKGSPQRH